MQQMAADQRSDKIVSDMEVPMKQRCWIKFLSAEKNDTHDIHWCLLSTYGNQTADVSMLKWWVVYFSSGHGQWHERQATFWIAMHSYHTTKWRAYWLAHPCKFSDYNQRTLCRAEYQFQCIGNNGCNAGISQSLSKVIPQMLTQKQKEHCEFFSICWTNTGLRETFSWITSLLVTEHDDTATKKVKMVVCGAATLTIKDTPYQRESDVHCIVE